METCLSIYNLTFPMARSLFVLFIAGLFAVIGSVKNPKPIQSDKIKINKQQTEEYQSKLITKQLNVTLQELFSRFINKFNSFINLLGSNNTMPEVDFQFNGLNVSKILNATITSTTSDLLNNSAIWWIVSNKKCNEKNRSYTDVRDLFLAAGIKAGNDIKNEFVFEPPGEIVNLSPDQLAERKMMLFKSSWKYFSKLDITPLVENLTQLFTDLKNNSKTNCQNLDELADLVKNRYLIPSSRFILDEYNLKKTQIPVTDNYKVDLAEEVPASVSPNVDVSPDFPASVRTKVDVATDALDSVPTKVDTTADSIDSVSTNVGITEDVPTSEPAKADVSTDVPVFLTTQTEVSTDVPLSASTVVDTTTDVPISETTEVDVDTDVPLSPTAEVDMATELPPSGGAQVDTSAEIQATENSQVSEDENTNSLKTKSDILVQKENIATSMNTTVSGSKLEDFESTIVPVSLNTKVNASSTETPATENSKADDVSAGTKFLESTPQADDGL